ncbi:MAG: hypothetical protein JW776_00010 [Candidatus Lokiarchaeota archaeon]|nr:hypothetical protein [Candidatus Lokiarchaeota archaeon]
MVLKKKKIREEFQEYFKSGNEAMIKKMLLDHLWLLEEWEDKMDTNVQEQSLIIAALGVMNDENGGNPVPLEDILYCLRSDFKEKKEEPEVREILSACETLGYCEKNDQGYKLTQEGEKICDDYLNSHEELLGDPIE